MLVRIFILSLIFNLSMSTKPSCKSGEWYNWAKSSCKTIDPKAPKNILVGESAGDTCWYECVAHKWIKESSKMQKCAEDPVFPRLCKNQCDQMKCATNKPYYNHKWAGATIDDCMCRCDKCPLDRKG